MAARILPFRSLIAVDAKSALAPAVNGPVYRSYKPTTSPKIVDMSAYAHRRQAPSAGEDGRSLLDQIEQEMSHGYLHVENTGISFRRLAAAYAAIFRGAWSYSLDSVRSLLRPSHAS